MLADDEGLFSVEKITLVTALAVAVVGFMRGWVVPKFMYDDLKAENKRLRDENDAIRGLTNRAVTTTEKVAGR